MATSNLEPDRIRRLSGELRSLNWPELRAGFAKEIEVVTRSSHIKLGFAQLEGAYGRFLEAARNVRHFDRRTVQHGQAPTAFNEAIRVVIAWSSGTGPSPYELPLALSTLRTPEARLTIELAREYQLRAAQLAQEVDALADSMLESSAPQVPGFDLAIPVEVDVDWDGEGSVGGLARWARHPERARPVSAGSLGLADAFNRAEAFDVNTVRVGDYAWVQLLRSLSAVNVEGELYIDGEVDDSSIVAIESALEKAVDAVGYSIAWGPGGHGSWWRVFWTKVASRLSEQDLDTLKRAGEVQILDRHESESVRNYSEAIAGLVKAVENQKHAWIAAKSVLLLKTVDGDGDSVVVSRVLTAYEMTLFQAGELTSILQQPALALDFVRSGMLPESIELARDDEPIQ